MKSSAILLLTVIAGCYAAGTWKECKLEDSHELLDNITEYTSCERYCSFMYKYPEAKGDCKSLSSGYFCQCQTNTTIDTHQSCKLVQVSNVVDSSDGLETCEAWCRSTKKSNTGTCLTYISGYYCDCY